jgi:hypothetical protein
MCSVSVPIITFHFMNFCHLGVKFMPHVGASIFVIVGKFEILTAVCEDYSALG